MDTDLASFDAAQECIIVAKSHDPVLLRQAINRLSEFGEPSLRYLQAVFLVFIASAASVLEQMGVTRRDMAAIMNNDLVDWIEVPTEHFEICLNFEDFGVPVDLPWLSHVVALTTAIAAFDDMVPGVLEDVDADIRSRADHS